MLFLAQDDGAAAPPGGNGTDTATNGAANGADGAAQNGGDMTDVVQDPGRVMELVQQYAMPVLGALVILIIGYFVAGWLGRMTANGLRRSKLDETLAQFFGKLVRAAVLVLVIITCLSRLGVQTTSLAAVIAAAGFAIGLAMQGTLSNFSSGVMLLVFRPFKAGDVVNIAGVTAKVTEIDLFSTTLDTFDNRRIYVPNGSIYGSTIENISFHNTRRVDVNVGTEYPADLDKARHVMLSAAKAVENVHEDPAPAVVLLEMGDSSINWAIRVWTDTDNFWPVRDALTRAIKYALDEADIGIPFPQMDVHLDKADGNA